MKAKKKPDDMSAVSANPIRIFALSVTIQLPYCIRAEDIKNWQGCREVRAIERCQLTNYLLINGAEQFIRWIALTILGEIGVSNRLCENEPTTTFQLATATN